MARRKYSFHALIHALAFAAGLAVFVNNSNAYTVSERLQQLTGGPLGGESSEILDPEQAFRLVVSTPDYRTIRLEFDIADGYYLYRDKFSFNLAAAGVRLDHAALNLPRGTLKSDEFFGEVEINTGLLEVDLPLLHDHAAGGTATLTVGYQGCKDKTICYPPITREIEVSLSAAPAAAARVQTGAELAPQDRILQGLRESGWLVNLAAFFLFGLLLSFTPCVLPMLPILSGVIIGQRGILNPRQGLSLSLAYVIAMALVYALLGMVAGSTRFNVQAAAQAPWVITLFSAVFVLLALSMFDVFHLRLPAFLHARLEAVHARQKSGTLSGAAAMGALSALIAGPCVAPPLAAALLYISQSGNALFGGAALFSLGLGLGIPLLLLGIVEGGLLPRSGRWMHGIKQLFGFVMLGIAVWFMGRILPGPVTLMLWAVLLISAAVYSGALDRPGHDTGGLLRLRKSAGIAALVYGIALLLGAAAGNSDPLRPLQGIAAGVADTGEQALPFRSVQTLAELERELDAASREGRRVMLDFYADWCVTCKEMERDTFSDALVRDRLAQMVILRADVTSNDADAQALLARFDLFGPPAILFFDAAAREQAAFRVIGFVPAREFAAHLERVLRS